jgi:DNA-binding PadR family transcriptional regulator
MRLHILHHAAEREIHGAWMTKELARHGYDISPGTLYPTLHRLEAEGLLTSEHRLVDGRGRRVYRVTAAGKRALREDRRALEELAREVLGAPDHALTADQPRTNSGAVRRADGSRVKRASRE